MQASHRDPDQRMEPVQRAGQAAHHLDKPVQSFDMTQFVQERMAAFVGRPLLGLEREQDDRAQDTPCHRHRHG